MRALPADDVPMQRLPAPGAWAPAIGKALYMLARMPPIER